VGGIGEGGAVRNSTANVDIKGKECIGGLVGRSIGGTIDNCTVSGNVSGEQYIGGLVGWSSEGTINNCTASGSVSGEYYIGGLVGSASGCAIGNSITRGNVGGRGNIGGIGGIFEGGITITTCRFPAESKARGVRNVGGVGGYVKNSVIEDCTVEGDVSGKSNVGEIVGLIEDDEDVATATELKNNTASGKAGKADLTVAEIIALIGEEPMDVPDKSANADVWDGSSEPFDTSVAGDEKRPYIIDTAAKFAHLAQSVRSGNSYAGKSFKLTRDLDLANLQWTPIGGFVKFGEMDSKPFKGKFDGDSHIISNLNISKVPGMTSVGLFGHVEGGEVRRLHLKNVNVRGSGGVGALVGDLGRTDEPDGSKVSDCSVTGGKVAWWEEGSIACVGIGGLVGMNFGGTLIFCTAICTVEGSRTMGEGIGGLVGMIEHPVYSNEYSIVRYCAASGDVDGGNGVGGLVGKGFAVKIELCESSGNVSGSRFVG
jgi:hypothetical protein